MNNERTISRQRQRRRFRVRNRLRRDATKHRLAIFRSNKHMYAQVIDDNQGQVMVCASTTEGSFGESYGGNKSAAEAIGKTIAKRALEKGIAEVYFDRREYQYHGRVAALAEAARTAGLKF